MSPDADLDLDPFAHDGDKWGVSLAQSAELLLGALDAAQVRSVYEVGAFAGDLTRLLVDWASRSGAKVGAVDPMPQPALVQLAEEREDVELVRETSLDAIPKLPLADAYVVDGDHNWHVVTEELTAIAARAEQEGRPFPLVLMHDVAWPHARRDDYHDVGGVPAERRHEQAGDTGGIFPGEPGLREGGGLPYPNSAAHEGGPRNGVLTAAEDVVAARDDLRLVAVPVFFGFGAIWSTDAPYADALEALLGPWDRHPLLARLEANRVHHLATAHTRVIEIWALQERLAKQEALLQRLLESSAFGAAERLSALRVKAGIAPGSRAVTRDEVRKALER